MESNILPRREGFHAFPKIPRLNRDIIITEKIDGTNAAVGISEAGEVWAQSRSRIIEPSSKDNMGFARWVEENKSLLVASLGPGLHFGEWWGKGIQRGYNMTERRFSLFNTERWGGRIGTFHNWFGLFVVPVLYKGQWQFESLKRVFYAPEAAIEMLKQNGSLASPGFMNPEGIVVFHTAGELMFKATIHKDEIPKELANGRKGASQRRQEESKDWDMEADKVVAFIQQEHA